MMQDSGSGTESADFGCETGDIQTVGECAAVPVREDVRKEGRSFAAIAARIVSTVLQPLFMPLYALLIILNANSFIAILVPPRVKLLLVLTVVLCTMILPGITLVLLSAFGALENLRMNNRKERIVPLVIILFTYIFCAYLILDWTGIDLIFMAIMSAVSCIVLALLVTTFWKISLHMIGIGGVYALLFVLGIAELRDFSGAMITATLLAGLLAASRLYLGRHTPMQVAAGFAGGFIVSMLTMMFI